MSRIEAQIDTLVEELETTQQELSDLLNSGRDVVHDRNAELEMEALINSIRNITKEIEALEDSLYH